MGQEEQKEQGREGDVANQEGRERERERGSWYNQMVREQRAPYPHSPRHRTRPTRIKRSLFQGPARPQILAPPCGRNANQAGRAGTGNPAKEAKEMQGPEKLKRKRGRMEY